MKFLWIIVAVAISALANIGNGIWKNGTLIIDIQHNDNYYMMIIRYSNHSMILFEAIIAKLYIISIDTKLIFSM